MIGVEPTTGGSQLLLFISFFTDTNISKFKELAHKLIPHGFKQ